MALGQRSMEPEMARPCQDRHSSALACPELGLGWGHGPRWFSDMRKPTAMHRGRFPSVSKPVQLLTPTSCWSYSPPPPFY